MDYDYFHEYMLGFVNNVIEKTEVDTGRTRVAVVSFSGTAQVWLASDSLQYIAVLVAHEITVSPDFTRKLY